MSELYFGYKYKEASLVELNSRWDKNIDNNLNDKRWVKWKYEAISDNQTGKTKTFIVIFNEEPIGEGTLIFSPECGAINGRTELADGKNITNVNALRIEKSYEGKGHISKLIRLMEKYAINSGYNTITIGVEARKTRNLAFYLHWGYDTFIRSEIEDGVLALYYSKQLQLKPSAYD